MDNTIDSRKKCLKYSLSSFPRMLTTTYHLSEHLKDKLSEHNINSKQQLILLDDNDLCRLGFNVQEIDEINSKIKINHKIEDFCVFNLLEKDTSNHIVFGTPKFDQAFGGQGLCLGQITQISGEAGCGKSQIWYDNLNFTICIYLLFSMQLSIKVQLNSFPGEALYLDTEDSFRPERISQIASNILASEISNGKNPVIDIDTILSKIHVKKINTSADDLWSLVLNGQLESYFDVNPSICLLIIDSIAYHFRYDYVHSDQMRIQQLVEILTQLKQIALERNIAVRVVLDYGKHSKTDSFFSVDSFNQPSNYGRYPSTGKFLEFVFSNHVATE